ncbi:MAG: hypothetical protein K2X38_23975 [Gemmataceae bacterium]|nr:hypothetical protein [Gemmataceae bacterium]
MPSYEVNERSGRLGGTSANTALPANLAVYDADGSIQIQLVGDDAVAADTVHARYEWPGREHDADIDLQYNRACCFDPQPGRWIESD